jgi:conjugal transfer pilus assembly protein TraB
MITKIRNSILAMSPKQRSAGLGVGIIVGVVGLVLLFEDAPPPPAANLKNDTERVLFEGASEGLTLEGMRTKMNRLEEALNNSNQRDSSRDSNIKRLEDVIESFSDSDENVRSLYELNRRVVELEEELQESQANSSAANNIQQEIIDDVVVERDGETENEGIPQLVDPKESRFIKPKEQPELVDYQSSKVDMPSDPLAFVQQASNSVGAVKQTSDPNMFIDDGDVRARTIPSTTIQSNTDTAAYEALSANTPTDDYTGKRVLAGSVLPVVLISGVDAPTGVQAKSDAVAATWRIVGHAKLPNGYRVDLRNCLVTTVVRGDVSTQRAYFRPDRLTCKFDYGDVDIAINGYTSGKDGSLGIRGEYISRTSKALLYGGVAGFAQGIGEAFGGGGRNGGAGIVNGNDPFALPQTSDVLRGGASSGVSSGAEFLTDYYKERLDELYDIIEVKPLIRGTIHIQKSFELILMDEVSSQSTSTRAQSSSSLPPANPSRISTGLSES